MAIVADFVQFSDGPVSLVRGGDIDRAFTKNIDATPVSGEGAVLHWMVWRGDSGSNVTYEVRVNGNAINTYTVSLTDRVAVQGVWVAPVFTTPLMVLPLTRPEYSAPPALKLS